MTKVRKIFFVAAVTALSACSPPRQSQSNSQTPTPANEIAQLPVAAFAGGITDKLAASIQNPLEGNANAIATGHSLFLQMNCASCHGYDLTGGMGPNLTDGYWRYGGTPGAVFQTIYSGRPQGMPAWRIALSTREIWEIVAYVQSKGGTIPAANYEAGLSGDATTLTNPPQLPPSQPEISGHSASPRPPG